VPDFYQGTELWELSLVDPDNRRRVDFALRRRLLDELTRDVAAATDLAAFAHRLAEDMDDGRVKLYLTRQALDFRRRHRDLFLRGDYRGLRVTGAWAEHVCAFARGTADATAVVVVPRLVARRGFGDPANTLPLGRSYWADTHVAVPTAAGARLRDVLTGRVVTAVVDAEGTGGAVLAVGDVLTDFPVGLLEPA
jgi:(1->4)-alpha-D-glucan 1-alpha-D-glucosylmutase